MFSMMLKQSHLGSIEQPIRKEDVAGRTKSKASCEIATA
jgi:hypothetical protein